MKTKNINKKKEKLKTILGGYCWHEDGGNGGYDFDDVWEFIRQLRQDDMERINLVIKESVGNNYHNLGIGSLDYHEKCAVDAFIETFKHRLSLTQQNKDEK